MKSKINKYNLEEDKTPKTNGVEKKLQHRFDDDKDSILK